MDWDTLPDGGLIITLYFGLKRVANPSVTEDEWDNFLAQVVTPRFMAFTVFDGQGQYFNRRRSEVVKIQTKVLVVVGYKGIGGDIEDIRREYQRRFHQIAVGLTVVPGFEDFDPVD